MAIYKPKRKTNSGEEEVKFPASAIDGLAAVATSGSYTDLKNKPTFLEKTTYEISKELACGQNGKVCLGKFGAYDTNITIELNITTSTTYHATIVIHSQNVVANGTGGTVGCNIYDDADNHITPLIKVFRPYGSASRQIEVYADLPGWSKNLVHVQAVALSDGGMTDVLTSVSAIPDAIDGKQLVTPVNALYNTFALKTNLNDYALATDVAKRVLFINVSTDPSTQLKFILDKLCEAYNLDAIPADRPVLVTLAGYYDKVLLIRFFDNYSPAASRLCLMEVLDLTAQGYKRFSAGEITDLNNYSLSNLFEAITYSFNNAITDIHNALSQKINSTSVNFYVTETATLADIRSMIIDAGVDPTALTFIDTSGYADGQFFIQFDNKDQNQGYYRILDLNRGGYRESGCVYGDHTFKSIAITELKTSAQQTGEAINELYDLFCRLQASASLPYGSVLRFHDVLVDLPAYGSYPMYFTFTNAGEETQCVAITFENWGGSGAYMYYVSASGTKFLVCTKYPGGAMNDWTEAESRKTITLQSLPSDALAIKFLETNTDVIAAGGSESMIGEWVFNDTLTLPNTTFDEENWASIECNGVWYLNKPYPDSTLRFSYFYFMRNGETLNEFGAGNDDIETLLYYEGAWDTYSGRKVVFLEEPSEEAAKWIKANAKRHQPIGADNIGIIDTYYDATHDVVDVEDGIAWSDQFALFDKTNSVISEGIIYHKLPIVAGDNISFEISNDKAFVKINAAGGSSDSSIQGTWVLNTVLEIYNFNFQFNFVLPKVPDSLPFHTIYNMGDSLYCVDENEDYYVPYANGVWVLPDWRTINITEEPTDAECIAWLRANAIKISKEEMPQIRFVGMPCSGYFGHVHWQDMGMFGGDEVHDLKFTIEIVGGGPLKLGDTIQICRMGKYGEWTSKKTNKYHPKKRKLRALFEYKISEEDLNKRFITFTVPYEDDAAHSTKLFFKTTLIGHYNDRIYFRVRRPKGQLQNNASRQTVDAEFSNAVDIMKRNYNWIAELEDGNTDKWCYIRIL